MSVRRDLIEIVCDGPEEPQSSDCPGSLAWTDYGPVSELRARMSRDGWKTRLPGGFDRCPACSEPDPQPTPSPSNPARSNRLAGHTLPFKGRVHLGTTIIGDGNGQGRTKCSCGDDSPMLPSTAARKKWHRDHKNDIRSGLGAS